MHADTASNLLHIGVVLAVAVGIALITQAGPLLTGVGVVLVIAGLIGLMPALRYQLAPGRKGHEEWETG
ncbi:MAG: hypothetical protein GWN73_07455, partial [Actinobacteria bacterium]|nr:hypothetical protein [Actinomycetota bacterium]NIU65263.1 hypothetical protein [Actinomycetota bacterium]NIW27312.1 hypothetical protein [Actinomycetota bacterium]